MRCHGEIADKICGGIPPVDVQKQGTQHVTARQDRWSRVVLLSCPDSGFKSGLVWIPTFTEITVIQRLHQQLDGVCRRRMRGLPSKCIHPRILLLSAQDSLFALQGTTLAAIGTEGWRRGLHGGDHCCRRSPGGARRQGIQYLCLCHQQCHHRACSCHGSPRT